MSGGRQQKFYSYNAATDEQQGRLRKVRIPVQSDFNGYSHELLETFSINTEINQRSRLPPDDITGGHNARDGDTIIVDTARRKRTRRDGHAAFSLARPRRRRVEAIFAEAQVRFRGMRNRFKHRWNKEFPDTPCAECAICSSGGSANGEHSRTTTSTESPESLVFL